MDIAGYISKKKLLGAKKSDILKYYELFAHKSKMDLIEALALEKEAIFRIKINETEEVLLRDSVEEPLKKNISASIEEYVNSIGDIWLTDLVLMQNTPYNEFSLRIDLITFDNGKKIAIRNYGNIMFYPVKVDTLGYCIAFKVATMDTDVNCGYDRIVLIDKMLNKYICISTEIAGYHKYNECKESYITYNYDDTYKLKILEKMDKISMEQIKEIEIV